MMKKSRIKNIQLFSFLLLVNFIPLSITAQFPFIQKISHSQPFQEPVFTVACQDHNGYIWLGSDNGLFRFDGTSFVQYFPVENTDDFRVSAIYESPAGILWVGCRDGRIYRSAGFELHQFNPEEGTAGLAISDILVDVREILWWSTLGEGVYYYDNDRVYNISVDDGLADDYVYDLEMDQAGMIYAATDGGISLLGLQDNQKFAESPDLNRQLPDIIVQVIKADPTGGLWLGHYDNGVSYIFESQVQAGIASWKYGPVKDLIILPDATWIATTAGYIIETRQGNADVQEVIPAQHPDFGRINDLLEDVAGNVWILATSGLYRTTGTRLKSYQDGSKAELQNIHAIFPDKKRPGFLWFSNEYGLFKMDQLTGFSKKFLTHPPLDKIRSTCIYEDDRGDIWLGTFNLGVFRIHPEDGTWAQLTEKDGLVNNNVLSISGHLDTLWMATLGGASEVILAGTGKKDFYSIRSLNRDNGLVSNYIYAVYEDTHDRIWFATDGDGISVMDRGTFTTFGIKDGLKDDVIYSITGDRLENIWIATASAGILQYDGRQFKNFGLDEGLSSLEISGLQASGDEVIVVQDHGLDILHIPSGRIAHFGTESGLAGLNPGLNVTAKDLEGNVWLGTGRGIFRYRPGILPEAFRPKTILEEMSVYMQPVMMKDRHYLGSRENHVSFRYVGLYLSNPDKVIYQVMLDGYDLGWKNTFDRTVTYSSLPYGEYTFRVRASLDHSFRNASEASYTFTIRKPIWMNWWFFIPAAIILISGAYLLLLRREKKLRQAEKQKKEMVEFEFQVLKNQVNPHFLFNSFSTLMSLIEEQSDQALQYTEKLSDFFRTILQFKDQEVISLREELDLINNYYFLLKKRFGDNLNLEIKLDDDTRNTFIPPMTLQILLENAVKHNIVSKDKPLNIEIYHTENKIIVQNNIQPKMTKEASTGTGLDNIISRYKLITKLEPEVSTDENIFKVILPVITHN